MLQDVPLPCGFATGDAEGTMEKLKNGNHDYLIDPSQ